MKTKLLGAVAACALALTISQARADTIYNVTMQFSTGYLIPPAPTNPAHWPSTLNLLGTMIVRNGQVLSTGSHGLDLTAVNGLWLEFTYNGQSSIGSTYQVNGVNLGNSCFGGCFLSLSFPTPDVGDLFNYTGGPITSGNFTLVAEMCPQLYNCGDLDIYYGFSGGSIELVTPLPAALPLFATGLFGLILLNRRRKVK